MMIWLDRLRRDVRGVAAVEFALLAPLMVGFYLGMTEVCGGFMAQKRMSHVTALVADLVAQEETINAQTMSGMFEIGATIMEPFASDTLYQRVRSVTLTGGQPVVNWVYTNHSASFPESTVALPDDLIEEGQSIIMSEAVYEFRSPVQYLIPGGMTFKARYFLRPRVVETIPCTDCPTS